MKVLGRALTPSQREYLDQQRKGVWEATFHALARQVECQLSKSQVKRTIESGEVIEFHTDTGPRRMLLRRGECCVVLDLDARLRLTTWRCRDDHYTLDYRNYQSHISDTEVFGT